jgi:uncharacterized protein
MDEEKAEWVELLGITLAVSHDGPGQLIRGADPFGDPAKAKIFRELFASKTAKVLFSSVVHQRNKSRKALYERLVELAQNEDIVIGCAGLVEPANQAGIDLSPQGDEVIEFRRLAFLELTENTFSLLPRFFRVFKTVRDFFGSLHAGRTVEEIGTRSSVASPEMLCVDIKGNILTYNNVDLNGADRTGQSYVAGHLSDIENARINSKLIPFRERCLNCPVLQLCKGGSELLPNDGPLFEQNCENFFTDNVVRLAIGLLMITDGVLVRIDGNELPENRKNVFGLA